MKGKLYLGKIDVSKIDKLKLFVGKKGTYCDVTIWLNEEADQYGNQMSIEQSTEKGGNKNYIGNCKEWQPQDMQKEQGDSKDGDVDSLPF